MDKKNQRRKKFIITMNIIFAVIYCLAIAAVLILWGLIRLVDGFFIFFLPLLFIGLAVLGVLFLAFKFYSDNHNLVDRKKVKKYTVIIALSLAASSVISVAGIEIKHFDLATYTREKWLEKGYDRGRMIKSFMKKVDLVGKTEAEMIYYLGEPDYQGTPSGNDTFAFSYNYDIGNYLDFLDSSTFDVYFNDSGTITSVGIGYH